MRVLTHAAKAKTIANRAQEYHRMVELSCCCRRWLASCCACHGAPKSVMVHMPAHIAQLKYMHATIMCTLAADRL